MNTTAHRVAPEQVMAFLDGELSAADAQAISAHLDRCAECSALAEQFRSTSLSLSRWNVRDCPGKAGGLRYRPGSQDRLRPRNRQNEPLCSRQLLDLEAVGAWERGDAGSAIAWAGLFLANLAPLSSGSKVRDVVTRRKEKPERQRRSAAAPAQFGRPGQSPISNPNYLTADRLQNS